MAESFEGGVDRLGSSGLSPVSFCTRSLKVSLSVWTKVVAALVGDGIFVYREVQMPWMGLNVYSIAGEREREMLFIHCGR